MKYKLGRAAALIDRYGLWNGCCIYLQLKTGKTKNILLPGIEFPVTLRKDSTDSAVFEQVFVRGEYDMEINFIPRVIIDAGAHIGLFSVVMKNRFPEAKIICIEPDINNCELLKKNLSFYKNIEIETAGLWNSITKLNVVDKYKQGYSALIVEEDDANGKIPATTIDSILKKYEIDCVDILKMDIEGSEEIIFLNNYENWLPKVKMIIIELHDWLKPGCAHPFFEAVQKTCKQYLYYTHGENTIIEINRTG